MNKNTKDEKKDKQKVKLPFLKSLFRMRGFSKISEYELNNQLKLLNKNK